MTLLQGLIVICVIGLIVYLVNSYLPLDEPFKKIIVFVAIIAVILVILAMFGIVSWPGIRVA